MQRPLVLIHGYSASGIEMQALKDQLAPNERDAALINICNYVSLNNEITIQDLAEGLDRAFLSHPQLRDPGQEFDAIVHSTGMLVLRAWLANAGPRPDNPRIKRLKHLIGLAPATWGSPQAHKGRTWLGAMVKGNRNLGPDFLNAGDLILEGLELASSFTWDLAHRDLLGALPFYDTGDQTPFVAVFIGNHSYDGLASAANDPGTDGTVRWSGCGLNTRKVTIDLTRSPLSNTGRVSISSWADRLDVPMVPVAGRNHGTILSDPEPGMIRQILGFLGVAERVGYDAWLAGAREYGNDALAAMKINPGAGAAGLEGAVKKYFGIGAPGVPMEGWQQFIVHAIDEHGDGISDYMIEVLAQRQNGDWLLFEEMYTNVHPYGPEPSYRCFHMRLPIGVSSGEIKLRARIHASSGTDLVDYLGYSSDPKVTAATTAPIDIDLDDLGPGEGTLFYPFTTTLIEIKLNRAPGGDELLQFLAAPAGPGNPPAS